MNLRKKIYYSESGCEDMPLYKPVFSDTGTYELVPNGVKHCFDEIQSYSDSCDLDMLVGKYLKTGDTKYLNVTNGWYADITDLPTSYGELVEQLLDAENRFQSLPVDVRDKFGNSAFNFFADKAKTIDVLKSFAKPAYGASETPVTPVTPVTPESEDK